MGEKALQTFGHGSGMGMQLVQLDLGQPMSVVEDEPTWDSKNILGQAQRAKMGE